MIFKVVAYIYLFIITLLIISAEMLINIVRDIILYQQITWLTILHIVGFILLIISIKKNKKGYKRKLSELEAEIYSKEQDFADKSKVLNALLNNIPCAIATIDADYYIKSINAELENLMGVKATGTLGEKCFNVFGSGKVCNNCPVKNAFASGKIEQNFKEEITCNNKQIYIEQIAIPILNTTGSIEYVLEVVLDATEKMWLRNQRDNLLIQTITALVNLIESRDKYTGLHSNRVRDIAVEIGKELGLTAVEIEEISIAAVLHDIGKIGSPEHILNKPGKLTTEEYEIIKEHPKIGYNALHNVDSLKHIAEIILDHHERIDGKGYPLGKTAVDISLAARILSVADVYEAITADRIYRKAMSREQVVDVFTAGRGTQFDPVVVDAFLQVLLCDSSYFRKVLGRDFL